MGKRSGRSAIAGCVPLDASVSYAFSLSGRRSTLRHVSRRYFSGNSPYTVNKSRSLFTSSSLAARRASKNSALSAFGASNPAATNELAGGAFAVPGAGPRRPFPSRGLVPGGGPNPNPAGASMGSGTDPLAGIAGGWTAPFTLASSSSEIKASFLGWSLCFCARETCTS